MLGALSGPARMAESERVAWRVDDEMANVDEKPGTQHADRLPHDEKSNRPRVTTHCPRLVRETPDQ